MKTTKTTTTAFDLEGHRLVIGYSSRQYYVLTPNGIMIYSAAEMKECYDLTNDQLLNMAQVLTNFYI